MLSAEPKAEAVNTYRDNTSSNETDTTLFLEIMHCMHNLQISQLYASR